MPPVDAQTLPSPLLDDLNPDQQHAVLHQAGALLIVAGPGSGKTRTITHRAAHLIAERGIPGNRILCVTFTNKAAQEMRQRVAAMVPGDQARPDTGTFHAFCNRLLRSNLGNSVVDPQFTILDREDQLAMIARAMEAAGLSTQARFRQDVLAQISKAKNRMLTPEQIEDAPYYDSGELNFQELAVVFRHYKNIIHSQNCLDLDDLLVYVVNLLEQNQAVRGRVQRRYRQIMVDEFQDTNILQYHLVKLLAGDGRNLCAVGDPDQCIYTWRGADPSNLKRFQEDYAPVTVVHLGRNYRSTGNIVQASANLISRNPDREPIRLYTENPDGDPVTQNVEYDRDDEARWILEQVQELIRQGRPAGEIAIMYRTRRQSRALETATSIFNIPYRVVGSFPFWQRKEIKDITAWLELANNPANQVAYQRAIATPPRGVGELTVARIRDYAAESSCNIAQAGAVIAANHKAGRTQPFRINANIADGLASFEHLRTDLIANSRQLPPSQLIERILSGTGLGTHIQGYGEDEERWENVLELKKAAAQYDHLPPPQGIAQLLSTASLTTAADRDDEPHALTLTTMHQAKGLEWPFVFIAGMNENTLPIYRTESPEEERRLCYVGMTRAMSQLHLSYTDIDANGRDTEPSRFIDESMTPPAT